MAKIHACASGGWAEKAQWGAGPRGGWWFLESIPLACIVIVGNSVHPSVLARRGLCTGKSGVPCSAIQERALTLQKSRCSAQEQPEGKDLQALPMQEEFSTSGGVCYIWLSSVWFLNATESSFDDGSGGTVFGGFYFPKEKIGTAYDI